MATPISRTNGKPGENALGGVGAPSKADAAPKPSTTDQGTGLIAALNNYWGTIAQSKGFIPDIYEIKFADPLLMNAKVASRSIGIERPAIS